MPKVYMYLVQTPPANKIKEYYRMSITHSFVFRKFREVYGLDGPNVWDDPAILRIKNTTIPGAKMYDESGRLHANDFDIPEYEPALENSIEADGESTIEKISDGVS